MLNNDEIISKLRDDLQNIYNKLEQAHDEWQVSQSPSTQFQIMTLENDMNSIVDQLMRYEGGGGD